MDGWLRFNNRAEIIMQPILILGISVYGASASFAQGTRPVDKEAIGPDLTSIHEKLDRTAIVDAIVHPDAAIAFGYEPVLLRLKEGRILIGQIMSESSVVELRDAAGRQQAVEKAGVESRQPLEVSLMPEPQSLGLTAQDVADIAGFLLESGSAVRDHE